MRTPDFRRLFESSPEHFLVLAPDLTIVAVSDAYLRATMTEREKILGRGIFDVFPDNPADAAATGVDTLRHSLQRVIDSRQADTMAVQKYDIRKPDGSFEERHWSPRNSPVLDENGRLAWIIHQVVDVTAFVTAKRQAGQAAELEAEIYRRAQEIQAKNRQTEAELQLTQQQLHQAQKMEAVGRLAGGIAHDFNNVLAVILSYAGMLRDEFEEGDQVREDLLEIVKAGERAAALTRQLLAFSRQQVLETKVLDLNDTLRGMEKMIRPLIGEDILFASHYGKNLRKVKVDPGRIEQVILNLVVNARDAMPKGGHLTIETANVDLDMEYARQHIGSVAGPHVMISVSDDGTGMSREVQARLFEPFFTTKGRGKGTGLGLATAFGIVHQSGGTIWVYSELGKGTVFKVYLPETTEANAEVAVTPDVASLRGTETILLVEDEQQVRDLARTILLRFGYRVLEATSPADALRIAREHAGEIALVLTDVIMPGMSGVELTRQLLEIRPTLKALCMSGYTDEAVVNHGLIGSGYAFLQKPFMADALARRVRETLAS